MTKRKLTNEDAVEIWVRMWLGEEKHAIILDFEQNPARVYEVWWEEGFIGSREIAEESFRTRYPGRAATTDFSPLVRGRWARRPGVDRDQMDLF